MCGTDESDYSVYAVEYLIENLVDNGDIVACVRVVEEDAEVASAIAIETGEYQNEARKVLKNVHHMIDQREGPFIKIKIEWVIGKARGTLGEMVS